MLAPIDKVRSGGNRIIQVVITRKCDLFNCSECTQLLPFRKDPMEMSLECIERTLRALRGWPGVIACFGGNPCTHSQFSEVCLLWQKHVDPKQRGLWTNNLMTHGKVVKETFWPHGMFNLNVHGNDKAAEQMRMWLPRIKIWGTAPSHHSSQLMDYADYGISEADWIEMRERCDINQKWSGAVYMRDDGNPYIYFCERAGALDGVRGTNNGVLVEPGCWQWGMDKYRHQVSACCDHFCGVPLRTLGHVDRQDTYSVSPSLVSLTTERVGKAKVQVQETMPEGRTHDGTDYQLLRAKRT